MSGGNKGFTLIELLIVIVIVGILATIATSGWQVMRERALVNALRQDLRNLVTAQEAYVSGNQTYATSVALLSDMYTPSPGVSITIENVTTTAWEATASHGALSRTCSISVGGDSQTGLTCS